MPASSTRSSGASVDILWIPLVWAAFRRGELSHIYRDVLLRLPPFRGKGGLIFPSHETLAHRAGCSVSTVKRALAAGRAAWTDRLEGGLATLLGVGIEAEQQSIFSHLATSGRRGKPNEIRYGSE